MVWVLCVSVTLMPQRECFSPYRTEEACWDAGAAWGDRAAAWLRRSELKRDFLFTCTPLAKP
jgi:hypothetical protein